MALWLVRAGPHGEEERGALQHNVATIGWNEMPDVSKIDSKDALVGSMLSRLEMVERTYLYYRSELLILIDIHS